MRLENGILSKTGCLSLLFLLFHQVIALGYPELNGHAQPAGEEKNYVPSTLKSATVYRNGAELVHSARATLKQGNNELIIDDISNNIDAGSIQVGCSGNVTIMSVAFSTEYLKTETVSPFVKKLQDSIESIIKELAKLDIGIRSDSELLDLLSANKSIGGTNGVSVAELSKMLEYYKQKTFELRNELNNFQEKSTKLKLIISKLENQVKEEEKKNTKTTGRIALQLLSAISGTFDLTVSYMTPTAYWNPSYDLKVNNNNDPLLLLYKAKLVQTSGMDWKNIKLSLSTSVPSQNGNAPVLKTWFLKYVDPVVVMEESLKSNALSNQLAGRVAGMHMDASKPLNEVVVVGYGTSRIRGEGDTSEDTEPLYVVNGKQMNAREFGKLDPGVIKKIDVLKGANATSLYGSRGANGVMLVTLKEELGDFVSVNDNQTDVTFEIDIPYDIPGNGKEQGVVLKEYKVPCKYQYYAVPRLDRDAYLLGQMPEWEKLNLLAGEANIMREGTYTGKSYIDPNSTLDTLSLTLGRDKRVVIKREKVLDYSSVKFLGSNKKQIFTYEITVRNNKKEKINLLLKDQYPISSNKDIEEALLENGGAKVNKETGVLTWDLDLAPGETKKVRISYSVTYPKDKTVNIN